MLCGAVLNHDGEGALARAQPPILTLTNILTTSGQIIFDAFNLNHN